MKSDEEYMRRALELAKNGIGYTAPNPCVGAVIVKDGRIIGEGWHRKYGDLHAERDALASCQESPAGATMYVTLEPCCHYGKQPPCVDAIIEAGIRRVVVGSDDPNPLVNGRGIAILKGHGIDVTEHVLKDECDRLNESFFHFIRTGRPYVVMKYAMTMDGKLATYTGASKWITGAEARASVAELRHRLTAIMLGVGTVIADDPLLTCRMEGGKNPVRTICDTHLRTPLEARVVQTAAAVPTILATCCRDEARIRQYEDQGCQVLKVKERGGHVDLSDLMTLLGRQKIDSILLEGGGTLNAAALSCGIVQKLETYIAPKLFGGSMAKTPVEGKGVPDPSQAILLKNSQVTRLGDDFLIESEVVYSDVHGDH